LIYKAVTVLTVLEEKQAQNISICL